MNWPETDVVPLRGGPVLRWGVIGPGEIAHDFVTTMHANTDQRVHAVASRSRERGEAFARAHGIEAVYDDVAAMLADQSVDIVYIATPNNTHRPLALEAIAAGKHVLVEKPFGVDHEDAVAIVDAARAGGVFAMEAMWSRFLPQMSVIKQLLDAGDLGEVHLVTADFGADFSDLPPTDQVFSEAAGGGAMRDIGIYALWFARFILGPPESLTSVGSPHPGGVDAQVGVLFNAGPGALAVLHSTMLVDTPTIASVNGTKARIEVASPFLMGHGFDLIVGDERATWTDPSGLLGRAGLAWQTTAIAQAIREGRTEAAEHPLEETLGLAEDLDRIRAESYT